jgi:glyoxylase-like metal-dependent hydrolase (beta-lactamase superfamily II)
MKTVVLLTLLTLYSCYSLAQIDLVKSKLEIDSLSKNLYLFVQQTNIANPSSVVYTTSELSVLIDPGFIQLQPIIEDSIKAFGGGKIKYTMLTHFHIDHGQALENYFNSAVTVVTAGQYEELKEDTVKNIISSPSPLCINLGEEELEIHSLPNKAGHTGADAIFLFKKANVLVVGDYLFQDMYPIIDVTGGGSITGYLSNMNYILDMTDEKTKIVPGHTSFKDSPKRFLAKEEYQTYIQDLKNSIQIINALKESGLTLEEAISKGLPENYSAFNEGLKYVSEKKWITTVYEN